MRNRKRRVHLVPGDEEISDAEFDRLVAELGYDPDYEPTAWDDIGPFTSRFNEAVQHGPVHDRFKKTWLEVDAANEYDRLTSEMLVGAWPRNLTALRDEGVKLVVTGCGKEGVMPAWSRYGIAWYNNVTGDDGLDKPTSWFKGMYERARPYLERGETVLFHCGAGINRGPSMAYFALRAFYGMSRDEATTLLSTKRPICTPSADHVRYGIAYRDDADKALRALGLER